MPADRSALHHQRTVFESWKSISIALYMALTGMSIYAFMYVRLRKAIPALADAS